MFSRTGKVGLSPGKVGLSPGKVGLSPGKVGLSPGKVGLSPGKVDMCHGRKWFKPFLGLDYRFLIEYYLTKLDKDIPCM
jgi:hypothetical protein